MTDSEIEKETRLSGIRLVFLALILISIVFFSTLLTRSNAQRKIHADASHLLFTYQQSIKSTIERLRHLPISAARDKDLIVLLEAAYQQDADKMNTLVGATNEYLESIANSANASIFYVIDKFGNTVASSNWKSVKSLVGRNFSYRPYFTNAIKGAEATYFAMGTTTNEAGYYYAHPVKTSDGVIGIVVVKTEVESLQSQWLNNGDQLILFDEYHVSILATNEQWRFKTQTSSLPENIDTLRDEFKYASRPLSPLGADGTSPLKSIRMNGENYIVTRAKLEALEWELWHLTPNRELTISTIMAVLTSLLLIGLSITVYLYRREVVRKKVLSAAARDADNMRRLNQKLEAEIAERKKAQDKLDEAQAELIQASKLAALGKMSAAIVHEVNQPLAAMRTFGASAKLLLDRGEPNAVKKNLDEISNLTERLATITSDLKIFAHKPKTSNERVSLQKSINNALQLVNPMLEEENISINRVISEEQLFIRGSAIRLEQAITNLLTNAIDATKSRNEDREVKIHLFVDDQDTVLRICDNGSGIDTHTIKHLFDPFFTTKPAGEGVGLGLAITYGIVKEMGGVIRVRNNDEGGALFSLRLRKSEQEPESDRSEDA